MIRVITKTITSFFTQGHQRTLRAKKNITVSFIAKALSILVSFLIVPLTLGYVGKVEYGLWMTISSIIQWFAFFDIGLGNGLRNKLAEALAQNDKHTAQIYISSAFSLIALISLIMFIVFYIAANYISWNSALNTDLVPNTELIKIVIIVFLFFCIGFVLKTISSILQAMQKYAINDIIGLTAQTLGLVAIFVLVKTTDGSLFNLCLVYGSKYAIVMSFAAIILFNTTLKEYRPKIQYINIKKALPLLNLGFKFFLNQILYLILTQSSLILVIQFFGPEEVTVFNLAVRYITITSVVYIMVLTPFLSAFTEAFTKNDLSWIKKTIKHINYVWMLTSLGTIVLVIASEFFFKLWVGDAVSIPISLVIALAISSIINTWGSTYTLFLNGIGKIQLQIYILAIQALLFLPLSYLFFKMNFGLIAIVAAQGIFYFSSAVIFTIQYRKIINSKAAGIWAR